MRMQRINHVGVIVEEFDEAVRGFTGNLGLELDHVERYGESLDIAFIPCGDTLVELIKPLTGEGSNAQYLKEHGPGIQHLAFEVEDLDTALKELAERGIEPLGAAPVDGAGGMRIAFLDPQAFASVLVELCEKAS